MLSFPSLLMCCQAHLLPPLSGINAPSYIGGVTALRLPAWPLRGSLHVVQDGSAFFPRACGLVRRVVLFSNGRRQPMAGSTASRTFAWARLGQSSAMSLTADAPSACCGLRAVTRRPTHDPWLPPTVPLTVLTVRTTLPVLCPVSTYRVAST